jgi:PAS domain S-box-containing protein
MNDQRKTKAELIAEMAQLRRRVEALESHPASGPTECETVRRDLAKWQALVANAPLHIALADRDGVIHFLNRAGPGDRVENAIGTRVYDHMLPEYHDAARECLAKGFRGESSYYECHVRAPDDVVVSYETHVAPVTIDGRIEFVSLIARDVTRREQARAELSNVKALLEAIVENIPFGFVVVGRDGRYVLENATVRRQQGDIVGKRPEDIAPDADVLASWLGYTRRAFAGERVDDEAVLTIDGDARHVNYVVAPVEASGEIVAVLACLLDITDRKRAESALKEARDELEHRVKDRTAQLAQANADLRREIDERRRAEEQLQVFQQFIAAAGQGFSIATVDGRLVYVNPALCRMLGESSEADVVGRNAAEYCTKEAVERIYAEYMPAVLSAGWLDSEGTLLTRQGQTIPVEQHSFVMRGDEGEPLYIASVATDISARRAAEEALRHSHEELRAIHDGMVDGLLIADRSTMKILRANVAISRMTGYSIDELLGLQVLDLHEPESHAAIARWFEQRPAAGEPVHENVPMRRKDGSVFFADVASSEVLYDGRVCELGFFRDVSERKAAHEMLQKERRSLKHLLRASDHDRQLIAYDIHDGLAQQIAGALLQFQAYHRLRDVDAARGEKAFRAALTMLEQSHFEARRLISGVRPLILDESGITAAIAHLVNDYTRETGPRVEFRSRVRFARLASVIENSMYRIVQEALANACKYSQSERIRISLLQRGTTVRIEVRDWGVGFDSSSIGEDCFGLEGIRERARILGGRSSVRSVAGRGTCVRVELPLIV